jgi:hypothetical protein
VTVIPEKAENQGCQWSRKLPFEGKSNKYIKYFIALPGPFVHQVVISVTYSGKIPHCPSQLK